MFKFKKRWLRRDSLETKKWPLLAIKLISLSCHDLAGVMPDILCSVCYGRQLVGYTIFTCKFEVLSHCWLVSNPTHNLFTFPPYLCKIACSYIMCTLWRQCVNVRVFRKGQFFEWLHTSTAPYLIEIFQGCCI